MPAYKLAVINQALVPEGEVDAFVAGASEWVSNYLAAYWPEVGGTTIRAIAPGDSPAPDEAHIVLAPTTTIANTLGYHTWTAAGLPVGIVELDAARLYNQPWTISGTHEIGELLINPRVGEYVWVGSFAYPKEICDPVTSDRMQVGDMWAANAVTPAWFDQLAPAGSQFDLLGNVHAPIPRIPWGGWLEWWDGTGWQSAYGSAIAPDMLAYMNMRRGRRYTMHLGHEKWRFSTIHV